MKFLPTLVALAGTAMALDSEAALGINCRGAGSCAANGAKLSDLLYLTKQLDPKRHFEPGVQLACVKGRYASMCAKFQRGNGGSGDRAVQLIQGLMDYGCRQCGSNPTGPDNDVTKGELTVNVVSAPCCSGNCVCPV